jgi:hypothetical protein
MVNSYTKAIQQLSKAKARRGRVGGREVGERECRCGQGRVMGNGT